MQYYPVVPTWQLATAQMDGRINLYTNLSCVGLTTICMTDEYVYSSPKLYYLFAHVKNCSHFPSAAQQCIILGLSSMPLNSWDTAGATGDLGILSQTFMSS